MTQPPHIVRAAETRTLRRRHPLNPDSEMLMTPLGGKAGLERIGVNLIRIPAGKQSFIPHAHSIEEEFIYVLEGAGEVVLDGAAHSIGPGDFVGFPTDGVVHHLVNAGSEDLVYLTGGERARMDAVEMPTIGRIAIYRNDTVELCGADGVEKMTMKEWFVRSRLDGAVERPTDPSI